MATAINVRSRDPKSRYDGGFDRWSHDSREGWTVLWRASEHADFIFGADGNVWVWDERHHIWNALPPEEQDIVLREHRLTMKQLRRAIPVMRLFLEGTVHAERDAARAALNRIGTAIAAFWQEGRGNDMLHRGQGWIDHPAALYRAVSRDCRHHFEGIAPIAFNPNVFAQLVAQAEEDFNAGLRGHPPRLRPSDFAGLQATLAHRLRTPDPARNTAEYTADDAFVPEEPSNMAEEPGPMPDTPRQPDAIDIAALREVYDTEDAAAATSAESRRRWRRRCLFGSSALAAGLALFLVVAHFG